MASCLWVDEITNKGVGMAEGKERYAIVKVNWICPTKHNEKIDCKFVCENKDVIKNEQCEKCRYGDTREQFINKLATGIEIAINEYEKGNIPKGKENRRCAEIIAGYLGVK